LKDQGLVGTTDPRHFEREHIQQLLRYMRAKGLDPASQAKILQELKNLLVFCKNHVMDEMKADGVKFPKPGRKPINVISDKDLGRIFSAVKGMEGWRGTMARGMIALYFATAARPKELRLAHLDDLDLERMTLLVRHPKGEGSWASPQVVSILRRDMVPLIQAFLDESSREIAKHGLEDAIPLFPNLRGGRATFYTAQGLNGIKQMVEDESGVDFRLKDFRSTLATVTINNDMSRLPAMSLQLRHSKIETTQKFYARIDSAEASKQLQDAYLERPVLLDEGQPTVLSAPTGQNAMVRKTPFIDKNFAPTGYA
jgi:integrase